MNMKNKEYILVALVVMVIWILRQPSPVELNFENDENIGRRLKDLRTSYHLSVEELSKYTGLNKSYLEGVEKGKYILGSTETQKIAAYFGQDLSAI